MLCKVFLLVLGDKDIHFIHLSISAYVVERWNRSRLPSNPTLNFMFSLLAKVYNMCYGAVVEFKLIQHVILILRVCCGEVAENGDVKIIEKWDEQILLKESRTCDLSFVRFYFPKWECFKHSTSATSQNECGIVIGYAGGESVPITKC